MLVSSKVRFSRLAESVYHLSVLGLDSTTYVVFIFLVSAACCAHSIVPDLSSDSIPNREDPKPRASKSLNAVMNLDRRGTDRLLETTSVQRQRSSADNSLELPPSDDYYGDYTYQDDFNFSQVAPEVLVDLAPEDVIPSLRQNAPQEIRKPVKDGFVRDQEMELVRLHNFYRSNVTPPAADMLFMEWDDHLAKVAQEWANTCQFRHDFPPNSYPGTMGQNLYKGVDPTGLRALLLWYDEHQYYNMNTTECGSRQCGHYTQMVWDDSRLVGCGMKRCGIRTFLVVCHYHPVGNLDREPYKVGKPCSQCQPDHGGLCINNLCATEDQCSRNNETCNPKCPLECHNCGTLDTTTCKCRCADGWDSLDCSRRCKNEHDGCGKRNGYPTVTYCSMQKQKIANVHCREMCGRCRGVEDVNSTSACCNGLMCEDGYVIDQTVNHCTCKLLCPGPNCYEDTIKLHSNASVEDRGSPHGIISNEQNGATCKNISDENMGLLPKNVSEDFNGTLYKNVSDEDNASQHLSKNIWTILFLLAIELMFS